MILFLTSSPMGDYRSDEPPAFEGLNPANGMVDELRRYWKERSRCLLVSAFPEEYDVNDRMRGDFYRIFEETGLSIACMDVCDQRSGRAMMAALHSYDMVILGGGHVPTAKEFWFEIGLPEALHGSDSSGTGRGEALHGSGAGGTSRTRRGWDGIVMGISAGSMLSAEIVYAQPEMPGEAVDPEYKKFIPGLGLTDVNVLPHYQAVKDDYVDGLRLFEEITYPDSWGRAFYAITDGAYLLQAPGRKEIRGEAYKIADGEIWQICGDGEVYWM